MKAHIASSINAGTLIGLSLWGYLSSDLDPRPITALIPTVIGVALVLLNNGVKKENKVVAHIAVLLTLIILGGLVKPLLGSIDRGDRQEIARVSVMRLSTALAMVFFVRSFIDARK